MKNKILCIALSLILMLTLSFHSNAASEDEILLARAVEAVAHDESYTVMASIASVLLNRMTSDSYPGSLGAVISDAGIDISAAEPTEQACRAARDAIGGFDPTSGSLGYSKSVISDFPVLLFVDGWSFY